MNQSLPLHVLVPARFTSGGGYALDAVESRAEANGGALRKNAGAPCIKEKIAFCIYDANSTAIER